MTAGICKPFIDSEARMSWQSFLHGSMPHHFRPGTPHRALLATTPSRRIDVHSIDDSRFQYFQGQAPSCNVSDAGPSRITNSRFGRGISEPHMKNPDHKIYLGQIHSKVVLAYNNATLERDGCNNSVHKFTKADYLAILASSPTIESNFIAIFHEGTTNERYFSGPVPRELP